MNYKFDLNKFMNGDALKKGSFDLHVFLLLPVLDAVVGIVSVFLYLISGFFIRSLEFVFNIIKLLKKIKNRIQECNCICFC